MESQNLSLLWNNLLSKLEKSLSRSAYEALISSTKPLRLENEKLIIAIENEFVKNWLAPFCLPLIEQELHHFLPQINYAEFIVGPKDLFQTPLLETIVYEGKKSIPASLPYLNPRYTFASFIVGHSNRFAQAAALAVAQAPAKTYNPLFLYGGVGLGKTHLMQAIAHQVAQQDHQAKILYITCEIFTNELIAAIQNGKTTEFRHKYRKNDLLLVDDIQFIAGKERTQEEFFHTFNALYETGKQVVVSCDRPPKDIPSIEDRLRSRFEWGLTADLQPPDFETRMAILKRKVELSAISIPEEILVIIAAKIISNIRQLEGALIRIIAKASLVSCEITPALAEQVLKDMFRPEKEGFSLDLIKKVTAEYFGLRIEDLSAKVRTKEIAFARQIAMYLAREIAQVSFSKIGEDFGGRDHTTVLYACEKMRNSLKDDPEIEKSIRTITENLRKYMPT